MIGAEPVPAFPDHALQAEMIRSFVTVSSGTLASRLLGFVRDAMVAALLGAGPVADAFLVAFQLVNVVRRLLTEGALNAALVPAWLRLRDTEGTAAAAAFAGKLLGTVSAALIAATALLALAMPLVIAVLAPGFAGRDTLQMAVHDARLMLPYLAFAGPVTVLMAVMNAQGRYALTAFSPLLFNIALIAAMALLLLWRQESARPPSSWQASSASPGCCSSPSWRSAVARARRRRCASASMARCAAFSPRRCPA